MTQTDKWLKKIKEKASKQDDKEMQKHLRRVCLICHKKISEHLLDDLFDCMNKHRSHEKYLESWVSARLDESFKKSKKS